MSDQLQCKQQLLPLQPRIQLWQQIITPLYDQFVPAKIRNRRNVRQAKLSDIEL